MGDLGSIPPQYTGADVHVVKLQPYPWQKVVMDYLHRDPVEREILWIFDPVGNNGKSSLVKYLAFAHDALVLNVSENRDLTCARANHRETNKILFDLPRLSGSSPKDYEILKSIESFKNGVVYTEKYESTFFITETPHVIVFSNRRPPRVDGVTVDRWKIARIGSETRQLYVMTPEQINDFIYDYIIFETSVLQRKMNKRIYSSNMRKLLSQYTRGVQLQGIIYGIAARRKEEHPEAAFPFLTEENIRYLISSCGYIKSQLNFDYSINYDFGLESLSNSGQTRGFDGRELDDLSKEIISEVLQTEYDAFVEERDKIISEAVRAGVPQRDLFFHPTSYYKAYFPEQGKLPYYIPSMNILRQYGN